MEALLNLEGAAFPVVVDASQSLEHGEKPRQPTTVSLADGSFVVLWMGVASPSSGGALDYVIHAQRYDAAGAKLGDSLQVSGPSDLPIQSWSATVLANGSFAVAWSQAPAEPLSPNYEEVYVRLISAAGIPLGPSFVANTTIALPQEAPDIFGLDDGRFVVTWRDEVTFGESVDAIRAQLFSAAGAKLGGEITVKSDGTRYQGAPTGTELANGNFLIVWQDGATNSLYTQFRAQLFNSAGGKTGGEFTLAGAQPSPAPLEIAALPNGGFVATWGGNSIQLYDNTGQPVGDQIVISGSQLSLATLDGGAFAVGWRESHLYLMQLYDAQGSPFGARLAIDPGSLNPQAHSSWDLNLSALAGGGLVATWITELASSESIVVSQLIDSPIVGTNGDDSFRGTGGQDRYAGIGGGDIVTGGDGDDVLSGGAGNDEIAGGDDDDQLYGGDGDDALDGGAGNDRLEGQGGSDSLDGAGGDDTLVIVNGLDANGLPTAYTGAGSIYAGGDGTDVLWVNGEVHFEGTLSGIERVYLEPPAFGLPPTARLEIDAARLAMLPATASFGGTGTIAIDVAQGASFDFSQYQFELGPDFSLVLEMHGASGGTVSAAAWVGTSWHDRFYFGSDTVTVTGGTGSDVFAFSVEPDRLDVTITDWSMDDDWLDFTKVGLSTEEALRDLVSQVGEDVVFSARQYGIDFRIVVENLALEDLNGLRLGYSLDPVVRTGNAANNLLFGARGVDELHGGGGDDRLYTGGQSSSPAPGYNDAIYGDGGDDTIVFDAAPSFSGGIYDGGSGFDTLDLRVPNGVSAGYQLGNSTISGIERLRFDTHLSGSAISADLTLAQASGLSHLVGGAGLDVLTLTATSPAGGTFSMPAFTLSSWSNPTGPGFVSGDRITLRGLGAGDFVLNAREGLAATQWLSGAAGNDTLNGSSGVDRLYGAGGNNLLNGNGGNDILVIGNAFTGAGSTFNGGAGIDTLYISGLVNFLGAVSSIEALFLAPAVNGSPDTALTISSGTMAMLAANLALEGTGTIIVNLAAGDSYDASGFTVAAGSSIAHTVFGSSANDTIRGLQIADELNGGDGNDVLDGRGGNDTLTGGLGNDTYYVDSAGDTVTELAGQGTDRVLTSASYALAAGVAVESLTTTNNSGTTAIDLAGNELGNAIYGNAGANVLDGRSGVDNLIGLAGDDLFYVDNAGDVVVEGAAEGNNDRVLASVSYTLGAGVYVERLTTDNSGGTAAINLTGNAFANLIYGNAGANVLNGGGGADTLVGLGGDDSYYVDNASDSVSEGAAEGANDRIFASVSYTLGAGVYVEKLTTSDNNATAAINLTGNTLGNLVYGNNGANTLDGKAGNDTLSGLAGNDVLVGGLGNDTMAGGAGDDWYYVDSTSDIVIELAGEGTNDRILTSVSFTLGAGIEVERVTTDSNAGTSAINLTGSATGNLMYGNAGNNILDGRGGADTLIGFGGDDSYYVDNAGDSVTEAAGEGNDRIYASVSYIQGAGVHVERLTTTSNTGTAAINLTGNELANLVYGNIGANVLDGKGGADLLTGLGGADTFAFTTALGAGNIDQVGDFNVADDTILLENAVFTGLAAGALSAGAFNTGAAASQAHDRIVYNSATGALYFDADGSGAGAAVQFATLNAGLALTSLDFLVV